MRGLSFSHVTTQGWSPGHSEEGRLSPTPEAVFHDLLEGTCVSFCVHNNPSCLPEVSS